MTYYDIPLTSLIPNNRFTVSLTAGNNTFNCIFEWFTDIQSEYNNYINACKLKASTDPVNGDREYDYVKYYLDIENIDNWLDTQKYLPMSLTSMTREEQVAELQSRIDVCTQINDILLHYKELLVWNVYINDTYTLRLHPGTILSMDDGTTIRVINNLDLPEITYDNINKVTLHVGVPNE